MSRIINLDNVGKERKRILMSVALALRELAKKNEPDENAQDMIAFITLALDAIYKTVDLSVTAWEKRGYWVKADRFRMEWDWARHYSHALAAAAFSEDWEGVAKQASKIMEKVSNINIPRRHQIGTPWVGAWEVLVAKQTKG